MLSYQTAYLAMIGLYAGIWLFFFVKEKYVRKEMLIVSLAAMPLGITMPLYADCCRAEYVFPIAPHLGLEDFAWAFFVSGIAAVIYSFFFGRTVYKDQRSYPGFVKSVAWISVAIVTGVALLFIGTTYYNINSYIISFGGFTFLLAFIALYRRDLLQNIFFSGVLLALLTSLVYSLLGILYPGVFDALWRPTALSGISLAGIPIEEIGYSLFWGALVGVLFEFLGGFRTRRARSER